MDLMMLTDAELIALGCRLNGGTFGRDAARMTKLQKVAHIRDRARELHPGNDKDVTNRMALSVLDGRRGAPDASRYAGEGTGEPDGAPAPEIELPDGSRMEAPEPEPTNHFKLDASDEPDGSSQTDEDQKDEDDSEPQDASEAPGDAEPATQGGTSPKGTQGPKADALEARVREIIDEQLGAATDETAEAVAEAVESRLGDAVAALRKEMGERAPREIALKLPDLPAVSLAGKHPVFPKLLALLALPEEIRQPIMLVGPAGSGKSHVCHQVADAFELAFGALSLSADMTRGAIEGRVMPLGEGRYVASEFIRLYESGGVYLFDEIDAAASEVLVTINAALANGGAHVEARALSGLDTYVPRHANTRILAAANTFGTGPTAQYVGRSQMDAATLDRFIILYMDYDPALSAQIMGVPEPAATPWLPAQRTDVQLREVLTMAYEWFKGIQARVQETGIRRVASQRGFLRMRALLAAGFGYEEMQDVILAGWGDDEKAQVTA